MAIAPDFYRSVLDAIQTHHLALGAWPTTAELAGMLVGDDQDLTAALYTLEVHGCVRSDAGHIIYVREMVKLATKRGKPDPQTLVWKTARVLKEFSAGEIVLHTAVSQAIVVDYLAVLVDAGYVRRLPAHRGEPRYRFAQEVYPGPVAPMQITLHAVVDVNKTAQRKSKSGDGIVVYVDFEGRGYDPLKK